MLDAPEQEVPAEPGEPAQSVAPAEPADAQAGSRQPRGLHALQAASTRRALLLFALGGLLIAGLVIAIPAVGTGPGRLAGYIGNNPVPATGTKNSAAFTRATGGDCLMWPEGTPESATVVNCTADHRFEVAESIDMRNFPGSEYGPNAAPPSPARIQQISQEQCEAAVHRYLGPKFDPNSKYSISMLWSGDRAWRQGGERRMLCGLQLPGQNNQQAVFKGKVADVDQSKVWPTGTCLGIDLATNQPIDVPVDCTAPHAMEVTGTVNVGEKFSNTLPAEPDQDSYIKDTCTKMTDAYLAPVKLRTTTLTLIYSTLSAPSWTAGGREVACSIGATLGNGGWATLVNSAKGQLLINGLPPVPPPDIPEDRLVLPSIPVQMPQQIPQPAEPAPSVPPGNQHLPQQPQQPQQQPVVTPSRAPSAPATQAPASPATQPPGQPQPPIEGGAPPLEAPAPGDPSG